MQLNVDVHNYMETLVGQVLVQRQYSEKYNHDQLADLACLALSQMRPVYIRHDVDFLSALPEERLVILKQQALAAIQAAEPMIIEDRRTMRDKEIPVILSQARFDHDNPLEWYEEPILKNNKKHKE